jgi:peptidoglycan/LPS O-acetylase OafA/YrhL
MTNSQPSTPYQQAMCRYESLDCLRGIAAAIVLVGHSFLLMTGPSAIVTIDSDGVHVNRILYLLPTRVFFSAHQAVILFFVLSGFALYAMLSTIENSIPKNLVGPVFLLSRWLRLYPVYIFSIGLAILSYSILNRLPQTYPDNLWLPSARIDTENIVGHITLIGVFDVARFNNPIWSIVYEMRLSIIFPIIYVVVKRFGVRVFLLVVSFPVTAAMALFAYPKIATGASSGTAQRYIFDSIMTVHYSGFFFLGALVAHCRLKLVQHFRRYSRNRITAIILLAFVLYTYGSDVSLPVYAHCLADLVAAVGSAGIIILSLSFPLLDKSLTCKCLGAISYSLYLMHALCLVVIYKLFAERVPPFVLWSLMIGVSLLVSWMTWALIEVRSLRWSRAVRIRFRLGSENQVTAH